MSTHPPVIVGAGPAGVRAAQALVAHGLRPVLVDEASRGGGQIYRRPPVGFQRSARELYGTEASRATAVHQTLDGLLDRIDYRPDTLVWNAQGGQLDLLHGPSRQAQVLPYSQLIVATGATDRVLPVPGWTLPGAYSLGGAQVALKAQGCTVGRAVVFMGSGPLLYLVAYQYAQAGTQVVAVLDTARFSDQVVALPGLLTQPAVLAKGLYYVAWLRARGVAVHTGVRPVRVLGEHHVQGVQWAQDGQTHQLDCDAVAMGQALRSETQLADLLGCRFAWVPLHRAHLPERDPAGRSSVPGVYLAGDGAGILGADAAEWAGERAALTLLADSGQSVDTARAQTLEQRLQQAQRFRQGLERAFPFPEDWAAQAPDDVVVCRCEHITAGSLRACVQHQGADELNRLKALTRVGMGRCQGRMCGVAAAEILAQASGQPIDRVGRLRGQAPIKPIPFDVHMARHDTPMEGQS